MISARVVVLAAVAVILTACSSTTSGSGRADVSTPPASSSTVSAPASSSHPPSTSAAPSSTAAKPTSTTHPVPRTPLKTATVQGLHATYPMKVWAEVSDPTCFDHAYGQPVIRYLTTHPCHGLTRRLVTTIVGGRPVGIATSELEFSGSYRTVYKTAGDFEDLVTRNGTGNLDDLFRDGYRLPSGPSGVPSPDAFKALGQDAGVIVADAWYLDGSTPENDPALVTMLEETFLQY